MDALAAQLDPLLPAVRRCRDLRLLLLFGSRARGETRAAADWDFGFLAGPAFDPDVLRAGLVLSLGTDRVDLVDLDRASGLLRYRAARDGRVLFESPTGTFDRFWFAAVDFWCDNERLLRAGYESVLDGLKP